MRRMIYCILCSFSMFLIFNNLYAKRGYIVRDDLIQFGYDKIFGEIRKYTNRVTLKVGQEYEVGPVYERNRSFTFSEDGQVMMFVNTADSKYLSQSTGARCFHLLPFKTPVMPSYKEDSNIVQLELPSGHSAVFSKKTGLPLSIEGFTIKVLPLQHIKQIEKNEGFFEIIPQKGYLIIDYGWKTGSTSKTSMNKKIKIIDGEGNRSFLKMSDVFKIDPNDPDEVIFLYENNEKLKAFLKKKCPNIKFPI